MRGQLDREHTGPCRQRSPAAGRFAKETFPAAKNGSDELRGHIIQPRAKAWPALISNAFHNRRTSDFARYKGPEGSDRSRGAQRNARSGHKPGRGAQPDVGYRAADEGSASAPPPMSSRRYARWRGSHETETTSSPPFSESALSPRGSGRLGDAEHARHRELGRQAGLVRAHGPDRLGAAHRGQRSTSRLPRRFCEMSKAYSSKYLPGI